jgi:hypothetical protein
MALLFRSWMGCFFVILILCHEMGHYLAGRFLGLSVEWPVFFLWSKIGVLMEPAESRHMEAWVAAAGTLSNLLSGFFCLVLASYWTARSTDLLLAGWVATLTIVLNLIVPTSTDASKVIWAARGPDPGFMSTLWIWRDPTVESTITRGAWLTHYVMAIIASLYLFYLFSKALWKAYGLDYLI